MNEISEAARQARNAHRREYYRQNPEKVAACNVRCWEKRAAAAAESEGGSDDC